VKRLIFAACVAFAAFSATPTAVPCKATATCALPVASGDLVAVFTRGAGTGAPTDSQGNVYVLVRQSNTYRSQRRVYSTAATATGTLTVTFPSVQDEIVVLDAAGYLPTPDVSASFPPAGQGGSYAICPPTAPLSITTKDGLLISDWALDGTVAIKCSALSGAAALPGTCGGATSQINYEVATAGVHAQQFTFTPPWNAGNANCGLYSFPAIPVQPPPVVTPGGWVFVGDSITANEFSVATQWHTGGINAGVAGNTTQQMIDRFPSVLAYKPSGVVILGGANDINGLAGATTAAAIAGRLTSMADAAIASGVQVVMCSILPLGAARAPTAGQLQMILDTNTLIKAYVNSHPGTRYADYYTAMVGPDGLLPGALSLDGLHPLPAGYTRMLPVTEAAIAGTPAPPPVTSAIDRPTLIQMFGLTTGPGLQMVDTGQQLILSQPVFTQHCIPQPSSNTWTITQQQHGRTDDGLAVTIYDDQAPRHRVEADVSVDPATLVVTVTFAVPQAGCVVVR
jgi:lysophospholipase L1-like esterase